MKRFFLLFTLFCFPFFSSSSGAYTSCLSIEIPKEAASVFLKATENIPCHLIQSLQVVEVFDDETLPRAMANARIIKINKNALDDPEIVHVLIHELGHVVDLGGLSSKSYQEASVFMDGNEIIYQDDKSVEYYSFSWINATNRNHTATVQDFAGEYASSDPFEDFAEAFLLYIQHGNTFRKMARHNEIMAKKYNFFKEHVFSGTEFDTGTRKISADKRVWDITKL